MVSTHSLFQKFVPVLFCLFYEAYVLCPSWPEDTNVLDWSLEETFTKAILLHLFKIYVKVCTSIVLFSQAKVVLKGFKWSKYQKTCCGIHSYFYQFCTCFLSFCHIKPKFCITPQSGKLTCPLKGSYRASLSIRVFFY